MLNIAEFEEAIINCRFCFMCRHLSGISNVTSQEADTPRVRAASYYAILRGFAPLNDPALIAHTYQADLSRACCHHCCQYKRANHNDKNFDENGMILAFRQDVVEAGLAPAEITAIGNDLVKSGKWTVSGTGKIVYFADQYSLEAQGVVRAFDKVMKANRISYQTVKGGCIGKALKVLGFVKEAKAAAAKFAKFVNALKADTIVVSNPAAYDFLRNDCRAFGVKIAPKVMHTSEFFVAKKFAFRKKAGNICYLESDFLKNYNNAYKFPAELLKAVKAVNRPFGTNSEESYTCGEGAVVLPKIDEELVAKLARYVEERADHPEKDLIVTASPYTKIQLAGYTSLKVVTLEELAAACL